MTARKLSGLALFLFLTNIGLAAQKHALLIGISHYTPGQDINDLEGPGPDVEAMAQTLTSRYGFPIANVTVLRDAKASRAGILSALDALVTRVGLGDYVFFYYSGHGTSPQGWRDLDIDADTGALLPSDFRRGSSLEETLARLVVGRRDLRPRLLKLDSKATVFAILDTCFSANSLKAMSPVGKAKGVLLNQQERGSEDDIRRAIQAQRAAGPYPYQNVAWISAALAYQTAVEVDQSTLNRYPHATIDGRPHGNLTDAVLTGLDGEADLDHDGVITHAELYDYLLRTAIARHWGHQPAWSANESNRQLALQAALGGLAAGILPAKPATVSDGAVRVQLGEGCDQLRSRVEGLPGITISAQNPDLKVEATNGGYRLLQAGAQPLADRPLDATEVAARIGAEPGVRRLIAQSAGVQKARLEIWPYRNGERSRQGIFFEGQQFELMIRSSAPVWPLVVDIDATGVATVLYPLPDQKQPVAADVLTSLGVSKVSAPFGVEYVKGFIFEHEPADYESWGGQQFRAVDPQFVKLLGVAADSAGDAVLRLFTLPK